MPLKPLKYIAIIFILSFPFHSFSQRSQINKKPQGSKPTIPQESGAENNAPTDKDLEREEERLDESQREIFLQLKKEYKEIINEELNSKIKKNPSQRKHLKKQYSLFFNKTLIDLLRNYRRGKVDIVKEWTSPGIFGAAPSGTVGSWGELSAFGYYSPKKRGSDLNDSSVGVGMGFGNPEKIIGGNISLIADSIYKSRKGRSLQIGRKPDFDLGGVNLKIGRKVPFLQSAYLAIGQNKITSWGYNSHDINILTALHIAWSQIIPIRETYKSFSIFQYTIGMGNKTYMPEEVYKVAGPGYEPFIGIGMNIIPQVAITIDRVSRELMAGINYAPFSRVPVVIRTEFVNILSRGGYPVQFGLVGSISHSF